MRLSTLSVVLEVEPASAGQLSGFIERIKKEEESPAPGGESYGRLKEGVPTLHFMSLSVFHAEDYDPVFVIEANFDGRPGPFWAQLEATIGDHLRSIVRCCKRPLDGDGPLYDAVTADDSGVPIAPYLERRTLQPSVFHHGNRGLDRERILRAGQLFMATRKELGQSDPQLPNPYRGVGAQQVHEKLRAALLGPFPWLAKPAPLRVTAWERAADLGRLFAFLLGVLIVLSLPGLSLLILLRAFFPAWASWFLGLHLGPFLMLLVAPLAAGLVLFAKRSARPGEAAPRRTGGLTLRSLSMQNEFSSLANPFTFGVAFVVALVLLCIGMAVLLAALKSITDVVVTPALLHMSATFAQAYDQGFFHAAGQALLALASELFRRSLAVVPAGFAQFRRAFGPMLRLSIVAIYTVFVFSIPAIFVWLRWLERRDSHHDAPPIDQRELRKMTRREDWIPQNHMGSIVLVKPGILRAALFRSGHLGLGLILRVVATDGYLGSMRTVHFAHWAFINNGSRLMFFSNFDHSWDSYLDDFIEKAHGGLTLAWGSGIGFPPTRFLVLDGASHGRQFKAWARHSMAVSRFWFSAYADYTVDQIERHARVADGLRKPKLEPQEAAEWAKDL
jgi:hypothetical protein